MPTGLSGVPPSGPVQTEIRHFPGNRDEVRLEAVAAALQGVLDVFARQ